MEAELVDATARRQIPVRETLDVLLEACRPHGRALGCAGALNTVASLADSTGADRQRASAREADLDGVVANLRHQFGAPAPTCASDAF